MKRKSDLSSTKGSHQKKKKEELKDLSSLDIEVFSLPGYERVVAPKSRAQWRSWLSKNAKGEGVWLVAEKKSEGGGKDSTLTYKDMVLEALCFGWIDGSVNTIDQLQYVRRFVPRGPRSQWSAVNKGYAKELEEEGLMTQLGRNAIERAKASGIWEKETPVVSSVDPNDLPEAFEKALEDNSKAKEKWKSVTVGQKKLMLFWILNAKRDDTKQRRINQIVTELNNGETKYVNMINRSKIK